jgi:hypothetical protein
MSNTNNAPIEYPVGEARRMTIKKGEMIMMKKLATLASAGVFLFLSACSTFTAQRYSLSADNSVTLKTMEAGNINVAAFKDPAGFDNSCRAVGPITPPDNLGFAAYIQKALTDELKVAGKFDDKAPKVTLSGSVEKLAFSSSMTGGSWDIGLRVNSSNGKSVNVAEHYEFSSSYVGETACKQTADAYMPAVQNLIGKLAKSPEFPALVKP